jgi:LytR cell envelope-related transcriptional attenuator
VGGESICSVQHAEHLPASFPWRTSTVVVGAIAIVELVALIAIGAVQLAPQRAHAKAAVAKPTLHAVAKVRHVAPPPSYPLRARDRVSVLVLNGNGVQGAASSTATRLRDIGYRIGAAQNAQRHDYAQSMVMYVPGWVKEARRLAHEMGVKLVAPVDGVVPGRLKGSQIVLILGT